MRPAPPALSLRIWATWRTLKKSPPVARNRSPRAAGSVIALMCDRQRRDKPVGATFVGRTSVGANDVRPSTPPFEWVENRVDN
jgi:hypothetical protein